MGLMRAITYQFLLGELEGSTEKVNMRRVLKAELLRLSSLFMNFHGLFSMNCKLFIVILAYSPYSG